MVNIRDIICGGLTIGGIVLIASTVGSSGILGTRGERNAYSTHYLGKPAIVKKEDVIFGLDNYYVLLNRRDKITNTTILTDDNKILKILDSGYSVRDYNPESK